MPPESQYFACLTNAGAALEARALGSGKGIVVSAIAVGDANRVEQTPSPEYASLVHEVCRRPIDAREIDPQNPQVTLLHATIPTNVGGFWIYELGVMAHLEGEETETLFAYANQAPYFKMLPQNGMQTVHELIVPIIQKTDARLVIELPEGGYVTREAFLSPAAAVWTLEEDVASGASLALPEGLYYFAGRSRVELYWLGQRLARGRNWTELGATGALSTQIKLLFDAEEGEEFQVEIFR